MRYLHNILLELKIDTLYHYLNNYINLNIKK